jgi:predicted transcriptional regulator
MKLKKIDIGIKGLEESLQDFARAWKALESGKRVKLDKGIYFDSIDDMRSVLTNNRLLILKAIRKHRPKSVYELAKHLRRDLKNVNQDLRLLSDIGLVTLEATEMDRKRLIPLVDYKKIVLEIAV